MQYKKKAPAETGAHEVASAKISHKAKAKIHKRPAERPSREEGTRFWLKTAYDGEETAFEYEPEMRHLTVEIVKGENGDLFEETRTWTRPFGWEPPSGLGWELYTEADNFKTWRRPLSLGWQLLSPEEARKA